MKRYTLILIIFLTSTLFTTKTFSALPGRATYDVHFEHEEEFCGFATDWDTGWVPPSLSEIQIRLQLHIGCGFYAYLDGKGVLSWPPSMDLVFEGNSNGGIYKMDIGLQFEGRLKLDIDVDIFDIDWEGPIPFLPTINEGFFEEKRFDPFLLSGNPQRPVHLEGRIPRFELVSVGLSDFMGIPSDIADLELAIDMDGTLDSYFGGMKIQTSDHNRAIYEEGQKLRVNPPGEPKYEVEATYYAMVNHQVIITFYLTARVELIGGVFSWDFDIFEVPVPIDPWTQTWEFNTEYLVFDLPDIEITDTDYQPITELRFRPTMVGRRRTLHFVIVNMGYDTLEGNLKTTEPFEIRPGDFTIDPADEIEVNLLFQPEGEGEVYGVVRIESNDPDEGDIDLPIFATGTYHEVEDYPDETEAEDDEILYGEGEAGCGCNLIADTVHGTNKLLLIIAMLLSLMPLVRRKSL